MLNEAAYYSSYYIVDFYFDIEIRYNGTKLEEPKAKN